MIGSVLANKYKIKSIVGIGGMAVVYKAYRITDNKVVAVKVLNDEYRRKPDYVRRFESEARAVMSLSHPNIIGLLDVGIDGDAPFIVLEFATGKTLKEIIDENGPLSQGFAVKIISQVLSALAHAHEKGVIHRDIKPQNIIVTAGGIVKLTDFGIAKIVSTSSTKTFAGKKVLGSVHYISPEQAKGEAVTPASDIYSTGIMLYEMVTGKLPFDSDAPISVALMHLQDQMTPACKFNPKVSTALSDVILKACAKEPSERYSSATEMKNDIVRAMSEPNGRFARLRSKAHNDAEKALVPKRVWMIPASVIVILVLIVSMFFLGSSIANKPLGTNVDVVPSLVGKKLREAQEYARLRGYTVIIEDNEISDKFEEGCIIEQTPTAGTKSSAGKKISVIVSSGTGMSSVPNCIGMTQMYAASALSAEDLVPEYKIVYSDRPYGEVISQDPVGGTELHPGDTVTLYISGQDEGSETIPDLSNLNYIYAIGALRDIGFTSIRIREKYDPEYKGDDFSVYSQSPAAETVAYLEQTVELVIIRKEHGHYAADIAFNVDIPTNNASIMVTVVRPDLSEFIVYENTYPTASSQVAISFCGLVWSPGKYECILYINGTEVKRSTYYFTYRGSADDGNITEGRRKLLYGAGCKRRALCVQTARQIQSRKAHASPGR